MNRLTLIALALGAACHAAEPTSTAKPACTDCQTEGFKQNVLRTYQVPPGQEKMVQRLLRGNSYAIQTVSANGTQTQFVMLKPSFTGDGYFVLSAPASMQDGVRELVDVLKSRPPHAGPPAVETTYWMVLGYPSAKTEIPDQLSAIAPALKGLSDLGTMRFEPYENIQVTSLDGEEAKAVANHAQVKQTASADADSIDVRLELQVSGGLPSTPGVIETTVRVKSGQFAVLGQAGFTPDKAGLGEAKPTLFYVMRSRPAA